MDRVTLRVARVVGRGENNRVKTLRLKVDANDLGTPEALERAAEILRGGGLVAFPTETVY